METIVVAAIPGLVTLVGVLLSNSRTQAVLEVKIDELSRRAERHNQVIERTYALEQRIAVLESEVGDLRKEI